MTDEVCELTILMPCLNEAETIAICVTKARAYLALHDIDGEVLVADNGSTDGSQELATSHGARVVAVPERGYGAALIGGIRAARGRFVIMGDADDSYDFSNLQAYVDKLREGHDLVMGNRFRGGIKAGAMPFLHRYLGNPVLSGIGRLFFHSKIGDFHCGLRGFNRNRILTLDLQTTGMEFASEMIVKSTLYNLRVTEVPTTLSPDGRSRPPHLRTWRDGWRHLRFLLLYSPRWLFLYPGIVLMLISTALMAWILPGTRRIGGVSLDVHTLVFAGAGIVLGAQSISFAIFTKVFAIRQGLLPADNRLDRALEWFSLEFGLLAGGAITLCGIAGSIYALFEWGQAHFGPLLVRDTMRIVIPSATAIILGIQIVLSALFLSVLRMGLRR